MRIITYKDHGFHVHGEKARSKLFENGQWKTKYEVHALKECNDKSMKISQSLPFSIVFGSLGNA